MTSQLKNFGHGTASRKIGKEYYYKDRKKGELEDH